GQDVALPERIDVPAVRRVQPLVHVDVELHVHIFEATIALAVNARIDVPLDDEHSVCLAQLELDSNRLGKDETLEGLNRHLVADDHELPAAREEPADIDLV